MSKGKGDIDKEIEELERQVRELGGGSYKN